MSVHVSSWVWKHSRAKGSNRLVLLALADMANDEGKCWPSIRTLSARCLISERGVQDKIREAEQDGELNILPQEGPNGVNVYQFTAFLATGAKPAPPPVQSLHPPGAEPRKNRGAKFAPKTSEEEPSIETTT